MYRGDTFISNEMKKAAVTTPIGMESYNAKLTHPLELSAERLSISAPYINFTDSKQVGQTGLSSQLWQ